MSCARNPWILLALLSGWLFAACSQTIGLPPPITGSAQDYFWSSTELNVGINYYVTRTGTGTYHLLSSTDGSHIQDGALNNEVTMVVHSSADSVFLDSIGTNAIFSLPSGYFLGHVAVPDTTFITVPLYDTTQFDTVIATDTTKDTVMTRITSHDTTVRQIIHGDTTNRSLLILYRPDLDSGKSWQAGTLSGPGLNSGVPVMATVLDHINALRLPPVNSGADSSFGNSFQIRYAPAIAADSSFVYPVYWLVYYSESAGPVLIEQYTLNGGGTYLVTQRAQIVRKGQ